MSLVGKQSVYQTLVNQIKKEISMGVRQENERLPSCRDLATQLGVNPNTVQRAYSILEEDGYIFTIPKKGVYVGKPRDRFAFVEEAIRDWKKYGIGKEYLIEQVRKIYLEVKRK